MVYGQVWEAWEEVRDIINDGGNGLQVVHGTSVNVHGATCRDLSINVNVNDLSDNGLEKQIVSASFHVAMILGQWLTLWRGDPYN